MLRANARMEEVILEICKDETCLPAEEAKTICGCCFPGWPHLKPCGL